MSKPTFYCDVCNKHHTASQIGGEWYAVNGNCFARQAQPPTHEEWMKQMRERIEAGIARMKETP